MREGKHLEALNEVMATIDEALSSRDILQHQRRLISMLSIGLQHIIEVYFHRLMVIKPGAQIKHNWLVLGERNMKLKFSSVLATPYDKIPEINEIISLARDIEMDRNDILYGSPAIDDKKLKEKIDKFFEIKRIVEKTGEIV